MSFLDLHAINKSFGPNTVVKDFNLSLARGKFVSFLGPSGCGKTTVLRIIAGFENPSSGTIHIDGQDVTGLTASQRKIGMVFQAYALFPNMNAAGNVGFGLKVAGASRDEIEARVAEMLKLVGLLGFEKRFPFELSGGQQQRVALARAIAPRPRMLLLDEPLSALDAKIRVSLRAQIREIQRELGITTVFVTHDQEEALSVSDDIVVMHAGLIEQHGNPFDIYNRPATPFVADFIGQLNTLHAEVAEPSRNMVRIGAAELNVPSLPAIARAGDRVALKLRPESMRLANGHDRGIALSGHVAHASFLGSVVRLGIDLGGGDVVKLDSFNDRQTLPPEVGAPLTITFLVDDIVSTQMANQQRSA
ncbi:MAG: ABC transporter ATP-binding protein [Alphaproteobacteria bacterium]|nr:ABC transporter ATP-binding protein [Alphaproteobacteria bacterium]